MSPGRRGLFIFLFGVAFLAGAVALDYWYVSSGEGSAAPAIAVGGPFTLTDQNGVVRHDTDFRGKLMLVYFGYTFCPDACPTELTTMSGALDLLGPQAREVVPVFVTVDPARDTVAQMKSYAANFSPSLVALTGSPEQVDAAAKEYRVYYKKVTPEGSNDYLMDHTSLVYLMGRDGKPRAYFGPNMTAEQMAAAIRKQL